VTDEEYEDLIGHVARDFHDEFIRNPNNNSLETIKIAVDYTMFIMNRFSELVQEYEESISEE
jgi:hypothetical protein